MVEAQKYLPTDLNEINLEKETIQKLHFHFLPAYALFLLENKLEDLSEYQVELFTEFNPPVLHYFNKFKREELLYLGRQGLEKMLDSISQNKAAVYVENSLKDWLNNQLPQISRNQIEAEDITLINLIRRRLFGKYISSFTKDIDSAVLLLNEIDDFTTISETISLKFLLSLQQNLIEQTQKLAKIGNWVWDLEKKSISWSKEIYSIYELENVNISDIDLASFNHPEDAAMVQKKMEISRELRKPHDFYYRIILGDGREKTLHAKGQVISNAAGKAEMMFGTLQDFTDQKRVENQLEENQHFIQKITDLTPSLISVYNIHTGEYLFINQAIESLLGYEREQVLNKGVEFFKEMVHPDDLERILNENEEALKQANNSGSDMVENIKEFRYRMRHKNQEYRWFTTYGSVFERNNENQVEKVINISFDITEQIKTNILLEERNREVRNQEERYFRMINEVQDYAILRLSREGIIENWNNGAKKIKGYDADEIIGKHFRIFYSAEDQENHLPEFLIQKSIEEGKAVHEGWRVRKDKTKFWGSILITALHDEDGKVVGFSKVTRDLTQKKIAEEQLLSYTKNIEKNNRELEEKNKQLESFNYIASHDLQEPIRKIKLFISRLKEDEPLTVKAQGVISKIENACLRMQDLINGLLLYCQADHQENNEIISLDSLLQDVISELNEQKEQIEIVIKKTQLPSLKINKLQYRQVFYNILSNSIKYKKENTPLKLEIDYYPEDAYHVISFHDNGIGFDQAYSDKIFGLFLRLHDNSTYAGTGLGLAICKKIVESHGGKINATGSLGKGATITIYLPVE
ncbi:MAG TPA: PAS domain-containing protein [Puia sp.]|nr:PAS domain-containing protein [Puia sp.]